MEREPYVDTPHEGIRPAFPPESVAGPAGNGERAPTRQPSVARLVRDLFNDLGDLTRQEIELVKAEFNEKIEQVQAGIGMIGAGAVIALAGCVVLLLSLVYALAAVMPAWAAALVVGAVAVSVGAVVLLTGKNRISASQLAPSRTAASLREDASTIARGAQHAREGQHPQDLQGSPFQDPPREAAHHDRRTAP